jgi:hypothetical protein
MDGGPQDATDMISSSTNDKTSEYSSNNFSSSDTTTSQNKEMLPQLIKFTGQHSMEQQALS